MSGKRLFSCISRNYYFATQHHNKQTSNYMIKLLGQKSLTEFEETLKKIFNNVFDKERFLTSSGVADHIRQIVEYGSSGKKFRGALTLHTYHTLKDPKKVTQEAIYQAHVLAWAVELMQFHFIISDDIQDESEKRRGKLCWHLRPDVGIRAVNDQLLLRSFIYEILKVTFENEPFYRQITDLFTKAFIYTEIGQHFDYTVSKICDRQYSHFTMDLYNKINYYKTQFYSMQLPILLGMVMANRIDAGSQQCVENLSVDMSLLFQIQDDYLDCFGNTDVTGKIGTDIARGKCSWLAVTALERCSKPQRIVFGACYGSREPAHIERIQRLYEQLQIPAAYKEKEESLCNRLMQQEHNKPPANIFVNILNALYNRKS